MIIRRKGVIRCSCSLNVVVLAGQDDDAILAGHLEALHGMPNPYRFIYAYRLHDERGADGRVIAQS